MIRCQSNLNHTTEYSAFLGFIEKSIHSVRSHSRQLIIKRSFITAFSFLQRNHQLPFSKCDTDQSIFSRLSFSSITASFNRRERIDNNSVRLSIRSLQISVIPFISSCFTVPKEKEYPLSDPYLAGKHRQVPTAYHVQSPIFVLTKLNDFRILFHQHVLY